MGRPREGWKLRDPRPPGEPCYTVRFTNKAGRRIELTTGTSDPVEAPRVAAELYARDLTSAGSALVRSRVDPLLALDELFAMCLADLMKTHDVETVAQYTRDAKRLAAWFGNSMVNLTPGRMGDYQRDRMTKVLKTTVQKERSFMNTFFGWCVEQGVLADADVPTWPRLPKKATGVRSGPQRATPVDVTREQVAAFLEALPLWSRPRKGLKFAIRPRFIVAYETGLRPATLDAIDLGKAWRLGQGYLDIADEDDKARFGRRVPISRLAQAALTYVVAELRITSGPIFGSHDYRDAVEKAAQAVGLPEDFAVYDLRHGRAGHLLDETGDVRSVMFLMGHLLMTTTNKYIRGQAEGARKTIDAMDVAGPGTAGQGMERSGRGMGFRGDNGEGRMLESGAKEGSRTLTGVTPPEPESGESRLDPSSSASLDRQEGSQKDSAGQGYGDIPETEIPNSVGVAARFLTVLRVAESGFEDALAAELLEGSS